MEDCEYYIHDTYIGETGASGGTWDFLMTAAGWSTSKTLVDVVNDIFNAAANAVAKIKAGVTEFVEGVRNGIEYLSNNVLLPIVEGIRDAFILSIRGLLEALQSTFDITFSNILNGFTLQRNSNNFDITFEISNDLNLEILLDGNLFLSIQSIYLIPEIRIAETLSPKSHAYEMLLIGNLEWTTVGILTIFGESNKEDDVTGTSRALVGLLGFLHLYEEISQRNQHTGEDQQQYHWWLGMYHLASMLAYVFLSAWKTGFRGIVLETMTVFAEWYGGVDYGIADEETTDQNSKSLFYGIIGVHLTAVLVKSIKEGAQAFLASSATGPIALGLAVRRAVSSLLVELTELSVWSSTVAVFHFVAWLVHSLYN